AEGLPKVICVNKVSARIVGRIYVDQLDLASVALLEQLEHLEVVALDEQVLGSVPVDALRWGRAERVGGRCEREPASSALPVPGEPVLLVGIGHALLAHELSEHVDVDRGAVRALGDQLREEGAQ